VSEHDGDSVTAKHIGFRDRLQCMNFAVLNAIMRGRVATLELSKRVVHAVHDPAERLDPFVRYALGCDPK
jgi:hypothetical protein